MVTGLKQKVKRMVIEVLNGIKILRSSECVQEARLSLLLERSSGE